MQRVNFNCLMLTSNAKGPDVQGNLHKKRLYNANIYLIFGREPRVVLLQLNEINSLINVFKCFSGDSVSQSGNVRPSELSGSGIKYRFRVVYR